MPQAMRPLVRDRQATVSNPALEGLGDRCGAKWAGGGAYAEEELAVAQFGPSVADVVDERRANLVGQRMDEGGSRLRLGNVKPLRTPVNVIETQGSDLACAQTIGRDQEEHRVVALPHRDRAVDRGKELADQLPP